MKIRLDEVVASSLRRMVSRHVQGRASVYSRWAKNLATFLSLLVSSLRRRRRVHEPPTDRSVERGLEAQLVEAHRAGIMGPARGTAADTKVTRGNGRRRACVLNRKGRKLWLVGTEKKKHEEQETNYFVLPNASKSKGVHCKTTNGKTAEIFHTPKLKASSLTLLSVTSVDRGGNTVHHLLSPPTAVLDIRSHTIPRATFRAKRNRQDRAARAKTPHGKTRGGGGTDGGGGVTTSRRSS